jgi:hypothetical protein
VKSEPAPPITLGNAAAARVRLIVWCRDCSRQVEPEPAELASRYGAEIAVLEWKERLVCSRCDSRQVDMVARVKCTRSPLLQPRPVHSSGPVSGRKGFPRCFRIWLVRTSLYGLCRGS